MSIWNGLLFLQGHVASPRLALALADAESAAEPAPTGVPSRCDDERRGCAAAASG